MADLSKLGTSDLKLGKSFAKGTAPSFNTIRYDFRPASVDTKNVAHLEVGQGSEVTVTVPHVEGAGTTQTVYKGFKKPCHKECVLIIDHSTGEITMEKLGSSIQLKKTRSEGSSKSSRPVTPIERKGTPPPVNIPSSTKGKTSHSKHSTVKPAVLPAKAPPVAASAGNRLSSSSSSSGSDSSSSASDSDMDLDPPVFTESKSSNAVTNTSLHQGPPPARHSHSATHNSHHQEKGYSQLSEDLQLSESGSDSD